MYEKSMALKYATECWKDIEGFPNYQVSNHGRVKNKKTGKILKPYKTNRGYLTVGFWVNGKKKRLLVHRLVAAAFIPNTENLPEVNHANGCKTDNNVANLEWSTGSQNIIHAYQTGIRKTKLSKEQVIEIRKLIKQGLTHRQIGSIFGVSHTTIGEIKRCKLWKHLA